MRVRPEWAQSVMETFPVLNTTAEDIPAGALLRPSGGIELETGCIKIAKPNADSAEGMLVAEFSIRANSRGAATSGERAAIAVDIGDGVIADVVEGDKLGSQNSSWYAKKDNLGWRAVSAVYMGRVNALRIGIPGVLQSDRVEMTASDFDITASSYTFAVVNKATSTPLAITIPSAGTYTIMANVSALYNVPTSFSGGNHIACMIKDMTAGTLLSPTLMRLCPIEVIAQDVYGHASVSVPNMVFASGRSLELWAQRVFSNTPTISRIHASSFTWIGYVKTG